MIQNIQNIQTASDLAVAIAAAIEEKEQNRDLAVITLATDKHWWSPKIYSPYEYYVAPGATKYDASISSSDIGKALKALGFHFYTGGDVAEFGYVSREDIWCIPYVLNGQVFTTPENPNHYHFHEVC